MTNGYENMDTFRIVLKTLAQWVMLLGVVGVVEADTMVLFQQALVTEKGEGDLKRALQLYEQVCDEAQGGQVWVVTQARDRMVVLRERLGLPRARDVQASSTMAASFRDLLSRDVSTRKALSYLQAVDVRLLDLKSQMGVDRFEQTRRDGVPKPIWIEVQFHKVRKMLGIQSFSEKLAEAAEKRRRLRPMGVAELFQAGLDAEKGLGDFKGAVGYYRRALEGVVDMDLKVQIDDRLAFCQRQMRE